MFSLFCQAVQPWNFSCGILKSTEKLQMRNCFPVTSEDFFPDEVIEVTASQTEELPLDLASQLDDVDISPTVSYEQSEGSGGKPGFISFYSLQRAKENVGPSPIARKDNNSLLWFAGPAVLVASFILPSLYLRRLISLIFEDSLLTGEMLIQIFLYASPILIHEAMKVTSVLLYRTPRLYLVYGNKLLISQSRHVILIQRHKIRGR